MNNNPMFDGEQPLTQADGELIREHIRANKKKLVTKMVLKIVHPTLPLVQYTKPAQTHIILLAKSNEIVTNWFNTGILSLDDMEALNALHRQLILDLSAVQPSTRPPERKMTSANTKPSVHKGRPKGSLNKKSKAKVSLELVITKATDEKEADV